MIFAKDLILKGVAGLAVVGSAGAGVWWYTTQKSENNTPNETNDLNTLASNVGLTCTPSDNLSATAAGNCTKKTDSATNIKVKQDNTTFDLSTISGGSIKVYKLTASGDGTTNYNKDFKFVIEGGDIGSGSNKLEEFETYEIKEETGNQWYLTRKKKAVDVKKKLLGLPSEDANCKLPEDNNTATCTLNKDKLKAIKFEGKAAEGDVTIDNAGNGEQINLKISKSTDALFSAGGYKLILETNKNITIPGNISIKKGTNTEFKIKIASTTGTEGPRTLTLEKAWTAKSLGENVGLTCPEGADDTKECTLNDTKINIKNDNTKKYSGLSKKANGAEEKKVKFELDKEDHNQGFKFFTEVSDGIALQQNGNNDDDANKKIEHKGSDSSVSYEIKEDSGTWYLTKKTAAGAGA